MESGESPPKRRKGEEGYPGTPQVADYLYSQPSYFNNNPGAPDTVNYATGKCIIVVVVVAVNGHRKQLRVTEYQQNCFLCLAFIDAR